MVEYFVDRAGAIITRERVRDLGRALTLRTDMLSTNAFVRSFWWSEAKSELAVILTAADVIAIDAVRNGLCSGFSRPQEKRSRSDETWWLWNGLPRCTKSPRAA